jgi:chromosome segregation ATPase
MDLEAEEVDEPKVSVALFVQAKLAAEAVAKDKAGLNVELRQVSDILATTEDQLKGMHNRWQEQQQQIMNQQNQLTELTKKLEDAERRFRDVTQCLTIQTTEVARERKEKRKLRELYHEERALVKTTKQELKSTQSMKYDTKVKKEMDYEFEYDI